MVAFDLCSFKSLWICMTKNKALKQAKEALLAAPTAYRAPQTIAAIEEALAQPEQEQLISDQINYGMSVTQGGKRIDPMSIYKEPEHEKTDVRCECCGYMTYHREHLGCIRAAKLKEPEQEPVAWATRLGEYAHIQWGSKRPEYPMVYEVPLYTTPPPVAEPHKRKPLTREQVLKIWKESGYDEALMEERAHFINGIRHAEVAHGIKDET